jgi:SCP-2 sterol transfer family protein
VPEAVAEQLRAVLPFDLAVFVPPNWDTRYVECFGFTLEEIYEEGARSIEAKFKAAGLPLDSLPGPQLMPMDLPPRGRAERGLAMLRYGFLGEPNGPPARDPEAMRVLFDSVRRNVDLRRAPDGPFVLQWDFPDAEPWHVRLDNGSTAAAPGRSDHVDLELRCRFDDWVDVVAGRLDPRRAVVSGRLRPRGNPRALWRARGLFGA